MARRTTVAAFEKWVADEANVDALLALVANGMTLRNAALSLKQPYTCAHAYLHSTPELTAAYDAARKCWADSKMDEALEIADGCSVDTPADVQKAKLRVETRHVQAKAYYSDRWGDKVQIDKSVTINADQALLGSVDELLRLASEKVVSDVPLALPALSASQGDDGQA